MCYYLNSSVSSSVKWLLGLTFFWFFWFSGPWILLRVSLSFSSKVVIRDANIFTWKIGPAVSGTLGLYTFCLCNMRFVEWLSEYKQLKRLKKMMKKEEQGGRSAWEDEGTEGFQGRLSAPGIASDSPTIPETPRFKSSFPSAGRFWTCLQHSCFLPFLPISDIL